ncbi:PREDICTED: leucine-rich repeat serine/threonine-protein kinase 1-like [Amphimedon queenslandica]|nr:PREDICTED: leucine-rich repeat serine/threonine-protein kinase 1-like [Amphimedon queenslandica]|eukprot:XP_019852360.1 PREDICTED: leucine-rich repeat serine/threonine-protein kinase 1-like [Amphimedon queenslandica]
MLSSVKFLGAGIDKTAQPIEGVDITVWSNNDDFSAIGYVVDQLDSLIDEWFPGLNDLDLDGEWLVERQALWITPPELKESISAEPGTESECFYDPLNQEVFIFKLEDCALKALQQDTVYCADYDVHVPLSTLVPDLLMTDLPPNLIIDQSCFEFNPKDLSTRLGRGGAGAVYKGKYRNVPVAVKEFLTQSQADAFQDEDELPPGGIHTYHDDDSISSGEALFLYRDMRQEVTVLAQLSHPNIVSILGVSLRPMCIALELAPMGSLFGILDKKLEAIKTAQADLPTANIKMPGGVLGHQISARIALQVALATRYLHKIGIVYRDLKSDNVLIWSLDVNESVNAKLADYGISRFANPGGIKGEEGTPGYMAPEAIKRRGEDQAFDEKVDIFSFGMLLFELITGQRPFESMSTGQEVNRAVIQRERPQVSEGNMEPSFPGMIELMEDCWRHLAADRPTADEVVQRISAPGFLCRRHTVSRVQQHPLQKIDTIYCQPVINESVCENTQYLLWTWSRQDTERNFSLFNVAKGMFTLPEKPSAGGRVFAMATTGEVERRLWVATSVARNFPDFEIQVFSYKNAVEPPVYLWSFIVRDSVLDMTTVVEGGRVKRVFASLANGTICVFSRVSISSPQPSEVGDAQVIPEACVLKCEDDKYRTEAEDWGQPLILTLSEAAKGMSIKYMTFVGKDFLWCGCGNSISVINVVEMKVVTSIPVFTRRAQLINELVSDGNKVWGIGRQLANVIEWDAKTYTINCVFDCSRVDPTGNILIGVPSIEEFILPDSMISTIPKDSERKSPSGSPQDQLESSTSSFTSGSPHNDSGFEVSNEPENPSKMPYATYNARFSRRTLRGIKPRERTHNMSKQEGRGIFAPRPEFDALQKAKMRSILRQQGATRVTSLLLVHDTLWIARGMGDVLVVDISGGKNHGMAIARLATEDSSKYGNRSNHKLCLVGNEFVVSSQWLEPLDMPRPRAQTDAGIFGDQVDAIAHQQLTVWGAWSNEVICAQAQQVSDMIELDYQASSGYES